MVQESNTKCSFCGSVRLDGEADWTSCDDIGERHPTFVTYEICETWMASVECAVEDVLQGVEVGAPVENDKLPR